jgi:AcrR family transcriptional regulator
VPRAGLDRATLVSAAGKLADERGYAALTLRALAERFGVAPPSLYNHVSCLEDLQRELQLEALRQLTVLLSGAAAGKAEASAVRAMAAAWRTFAHEHPGLYAATVRAPDAHDAQALAATKAVLDVVLAVLSGCGLKQSAAVHAARALRSSLHGFVALEAAAGFGLPEERDESFALLVEIVIAGLPAAAASRRRRT